VLNISRLRDLPTIVLAFRSLTEGATLRTVVMLLADEGTFRDGCFPSKLKERELHEKEESGATEKRRAEQVEEPVEHVE
jgi:hypothetical protein